MLNGAASRAHQVVSLHHGPIHFSSHSIVVYKLYSADVNGIHGEYDYHNRPTSTVCTEQCLTALVLAFSVRRSLVNKGLAKLISTNCHRPRSRCNPITQRGTVLPRVLIVRNVHKRVPAVYQSDAL